MHMCPHAGAVPLMASIKERSMGTNVAYSSTYLYLYIYLSIYLPTYII